MERSDCGVTWTVPWWPFGRTRRGDSLVPDRPVAVESGFRRVPAVRRTTDRSDRHHRHPTARVSPAVPRAHAALVGGVSIGENRNVLSAGRSPPTFGRPAPVHSMSSESSSTSSVSGSVTSTPSTPSAPRVDRTRPAVSLSRPLDTRCSRCPRRPSGRGSSNPRFSLRPARACPAIARVRRWPGRGRSGRISSRSPS